MTSKGSRASPPGARRRTNIPPDPGGFIGRERETQRLDEVLAAGERAITIVGAGGIGKSRLATRWARAHADDVPGGAWIVELVDARELTSACAAVARALDLPPPSGSDPAEELAASVGDLEPPLLVLDECEHLPELPSIAARILARAPEAVLVATSRARLKLPSEIVLELPPLGVEGAADSEAVRFLVDRMQRRVSGYEPSAAELGALARIVERLDGIPLALELAAARLPVLGASNLAARLARGLEALGTNDGSVAARHRTLQAAIEWSWALLSDEDRRALAVVSAFAGGFDAPAAEALLGADALARIEALVDQSLIAIQRRDGAPRMRCYETIRSFAVDRLAERPDAIDVEHAHARHYVERCEALAREVDGHDGVRARAELVLEAPNLAAAIERLLGAQKRPRDTASLAHRGALALDRALALSGMLDREIAMLGSVLETFARAPRSLSARVHLARANPRRIRGDGAGAIDDLDRALDLARTEQDRAFVGEVFNVRARALISLARLTTEDPGPMLEEALAIAREIGSRAQEAHALNSLGVRDYEAERRDRARERVVESLRMFREVGDASWTVISACQVGIMDLEADRIDDAARAFDEGARAAERIGDWNPLAMTIQGRGWVAHARGDLVEAAKAYEEVLALYRRLAARRFEGIILSYLGLVDRERGDVHSALTALEEARSLLTRSGDLRHASIASSHLAAACAELGRIEEARAAVDRADELNAADPFSPSQAIAALARAYLPETAPRAREILAQAERGELGADGGRSFDLRLAIRVARAALGRIARPDAIDSAGAFVVQKDGRWFQVPGQPPVRCDTRHLARRLVLRLVAERTAAPGKAVSRDDLFDAGWPGEKVVPYSARNRLHVAMATLRRLGLRTVLLSTDAGYLLDPAIPCRVVG
jgi:predicted ATPase